MKRMVTREVNGVLETSLMTNEQRRILKELGLPGVSIEKLEQMQAQIKTATPEREQTEKELSRLVKVI